METQNLSSKPKVWVGIDPGKLGGIIILPENYEDLEFYVMPMIGSEYNIQRLDEIFSHISYNFNATIFLESVHSIAGVSAKSNFDFGEGFGLLQGIIVSKKIPLLKVQPKAWQKLFFSGIPDQNKSVVVSGKTVIQRDTKVMARLSMNQLYPKFTGLASSRSSKPHEGLVDALGIAHYGKQTYH